MTPQLRESVEVILDRFGPEPFDLAVILGSGLGEVADSANLEAAIPYSELTFLPRGQVSGHRGRLVAGTLDGKRILFFQGRFHLYQGITARAAAAPVELAHALGCDKLLLTNASGGIDQDLTPGEFMLISDQINLMGDNPLRGEPEQPFVSCCELYRQECFESLAAAAKSDGWKLRRGVVCGMLGPSYETPAEIRALQVLGADAVSMSTIPEAIMAGYFGLKTWGVSLIANRAAGLSATQLSHEEVLTIGTSAVPRMVLLLKALLNDFC